MPLRMLRVLGRSINDLIETEVVVFSITREVTSAQKVLFLTLFIVGFESFLCTNHSN